MKNCKKFLPYLILLVICFAIPFLFTSRSWIQLFVTIVINIIGAVSLRTIMLSGNMSFAHGAFMGVGAYTAGILALKAGLPIFITIPIGAIVATIIGLITGWPFARLKSIYFCMGTMFMGQAIILLISTLDIAGGAIGLTGLPSMGKALEPVADGLGLSKPQVSYLFILLVAVLSLAVMFRFEHSRIGTTLRALSQSEDVAASIGVNPTFYRLLAVGVGCFFAGLAGACSAHYSGNLSPNTYTMNLTLWLIMYMMVGGTGTFLGPVIGAIVVSTIQNIANLLVGLSGASSSGAFVSFATWVGNKAAYTPFLTALLLLLVAYLLPKGLVGLPSTIRENRAKRQEKKEIAEMMKGGSK